MRSTNTLKAEKLYIIYFKAVKNRIATQKSE